MFTCNCHAEFLCFPVPVFDTETICKVSLSWFPDPLSGDAARGAGPAAAGPGGRAPQAGGQASVGGAGEDRPDG